MRRFIALIGALLVAGCGQSPGPKAGGSSEDPDCAPEVIAHRGEPAVAPEETMQSFRAAVDHGATVLEGDIRFTKDGVAIMIHDETVDRTTDGTGLVKNFTLTQLRRLDAGGGGQIPTLAELTRFGRMAHLRLVVELKNTGVTQTQVSTVLREVKGVQQQTTIESFSARQRSLSCGGSSRQCGLP